MDKKHLEKGEDLQIYPTNQAHVLKFMVSFFVFDSFVDGQQIWEMEATVDKDKSQPVRTKTPDCSFDTKTCNMNTKHIKCPDPAACFQPKTQFQC